MATEQTENEIIKFVDLDLLIKKERSEKPINSSGHNISGKLFENEWLQEYELIYALQELEDWNLEEPDSA